MEHSAKDILDMAKKTLGLDTFPEDKPKEITEFSKPLADVIIEEDGTHVDSTTGEVLEEAPVMQSLGDMEPIYSLGDMEQPAGYIPVHEEVVVEEVPEVKEVHAVSVYHPGSSQVASYIEPMPEPQRPYVQATTYNKFADYPQQLREEPTEINLHEVKKLNLAAMIETLEQATTSYQSFPSADAALAISSISAQVHKLTTELEKSNDPKKLSEKLEVSLLQPFAKDMLAAVSAEFKYFVEASKEIIPSEKQAAFMKLVSEIVSSRMGPAMQEALESNTVRLQKVLGVKERV